MKFLHCSFIVIIFLLISCQQKVDLDKYTQVQTESSNTEKRICLCVDSSRLGDDSFNDMQYNGLIIASTKFDNLKLHYSQATSDKKEDMIKAIKILAEDKKCHLIFASSFQLTQVVTEYSKNYPNTMFVNMDSNSSSKNLVSVQFGQHQGSFVVGAFSAMMSKTKKIGFIGGVDIAVVKAFEIGFMEGVKYINPEIDVQIEYCSKYPDFKGFNDPDTGAKIADKMYSQGCDIIYSVAGATGNGIIKKAVEKKKFVIGVDSNQDHLAPGLVLTSMMKRLDNAVIDITKKFVLGEFEGNRIYHYDYSNGGISLTEMEFTKDKIPQEVLSKIKDIESKIKSGTIKVTNFLETKK